MAGPNGRVAVFWGCRALTGDLPFEMSTRAVLRALGVPFEDLRGQACCGEPVRSLSVSASCYLALRLLALASKQGFGDLLVPCSKGYYMMRWAPKILASSGAIRERVEKALASEGLNPQELARPWSLVDFLYERVGPDKIAISCQDPLSLRVAIHPGCYLLRAGERGEGSERLGRLRAILEAVGVEAPYYPGIDECCGGTLEAIRPDAALALAGSKLKAASEAGLACLVVACPACFEMLDGRQEEALGAVGGGKAMPVLYLTQLLGLALGLRPGELGLQFNRSPVEDIGSIVGRGARAGSASSASS